MLTTGGATSTLIDPVHVYNQIGEFTVVLTLRAEPQGEAATAGSQSDVESKAGYISVSGLPALVTRTITYTYDGLYRLTEADYSSGERFQYAYDAVGNRTAYTATITQTTITTYSHDAANRLVNAGGVAYTWSDAGRLLDDGTYQYILQQAQDRPGTRRGG